MALGAVLGTALTTQVIRSFGLWINSLDVTGDPAGNYGVNLNSITATMGAPGTNSSLSFTLDDPTNSITIPRGAYVRFASYTAGDLFGGFVDHATKHTDFGNQGRKIDVTCNGTEILLDWLTTSADLIFTNNGPGLSGPGEWSIPQAVVRIVQNVSSSTSGLRYGNDGTLGLGGGTPTYPVGLGGAFTTPSVPFTITAGSTLRSALQTLSDNTFGFEFTVDPLFGLRVFHRFNDTASGEASDAVDWAINPSGANLPASIQHTSDDTSIVRAVRVVGTGVSLYVTDGTAILGETATITDPAITSTGVASVVATSYLNQHAGGTRGSVTLETVNSVAYGSAYGRTDLRNNTTMSLTGATSSIFLTYSIDLSNFAGSTYDAQFNYGGVIASGANLIRTLTRSTSS